MQLKVSTEPAVWISDFTGRGGVGFLAEFLAVVGFSRLIRLRKCGDMVIEKQKKHNRYDLVDRRSDRLAKIGIETR